jgi:curved DNA-binding protein CbpA
MLQLSYIYDIIYIEVKKRKGVKNMYFKNCETLEDLKKEYYRLSKKNHPDLGGNEDIMKEINNQYDETFKVLKNIRRNQKGKTYTKETNETADFFKDIIENIIHFPGIEIEIIGAWIWISGDTKKYKDEFKKLGFKWSFKKYMWFHNNGDVSKSRGSKTIEEIRNLYGSVKVETEELEKIKEAV